MQGKEDRKRKNAKKVETAKKVKLELKLIYLKQNY